jgi:hypothetical protein
MNISEKQFMEHRIAILPRRGAEKEHSWTIVESDLPDVWTATRPREITRKWYDDKAGVEWTFTLQWIKARPTPVLKVSR